MVAIARAFWGSRAQDERSGAAGILATLEALRGLDSEHYGRWFELGDSEEDALRRPVPVGLEAIRRRLSRHFTDTDHAIIEDLGYTFWVWNGDRRDEHALNFSCAFSITSSAVTNSLVFGLPPGWESDQASLRTILDLVVRLWSPDRANIWDASDRELARAEL